MTPDEYLQSLITKYKASTGTGSVAYNAGNAIYPIIKKWAGVQLREVSFSGSNAKGTAIHGTTDVDLFISLKSDTKETMKQLFDKLFTTMKGNGYTGALKQNVSIHVNHVGIDVDLVPAVHFGDNSEDHWLYVNKPNRDRTKTNITTHINLVKGSGRINEIILAKIWRKNHGLDFPSFYLELAVIEALKYTRTGLADNFIKILEYLRDLLATARHVDPANSNNIISDDLTVAEKKIIADQAKKSRAEPKWEQTVW